MTYYDSKTYELAEYFLSEKPFSKDKVDSLAQYIQAAIEDWLYDDCGQIRAHAQPDHKCSMTTCNFIHEKLAKPEAKP